MYSQHSLHKSIVSLEILHSQPPFHVPRCCREAEEHRHVERLGGLQEEGMRIDPRERCEENNHMVACLQVTRVDAETGFELRMMRMMRMMKRKTDRGAIELYR
jgi:hypothetical protein